MCAGVLPKKAPSRPTLRVLNDYEELFVIGLVLENPTIGTNVSISTINFLDS